MDNHNRDSQRKSYITMRRTYDFTMAILLLGMAVVMFFAEKFNVVQVMQLDKLMRGLFGGICLLYGGFRVYRGIKAEY